jgi:DNA-binding IclR family transcriptional regulator
MKALRRRPPEERARAPAGVAAVERALTILGAFDGSRPAMGLAELALRTGYYKSTILRSLASLERHAFVERGTDGRYRIGPGAWRAGALFLRELRLDERLLPPMRELAAQSRESVSFYVPLPDDRPPARVCLLRVDADRSVREHVRVGDRLPLGEGATGRVLKAFLETGGPELARIRRDRVHGSWGERDPEIAGVAAPVLGPDGALVGALVLSAPTARHDRRWIDAMKPQVRAAAARTSRELGFSGEGRP